MIPWGLALERMLGSGLEGGFECKGEGMAGIFEEPLSSKNGVREKLGMRLEI